MPAFSGRMVCCALIILMLVVGCGGTPEGSTPEISSEASAVNVSICGIYCDQRDQRDPAAAAGDARPVSPVVIHGRQIVLHASAADGMVWGSVENATGGDEVWLDRSFDNGASWSNGSRLGDTRTHSGHSPVGDAVVSTRRIALHVFNGDDMAWASLEDSGSGDRVWLDRSWDGGGFWSGGSMLGLAQVGRGGNSARTGMFNLNEPRFMLAGSVLRACGNASRGDTGCTAWARAAPSRTAAGATALAAFYLGNFAYGLWWQTAQGITALLNDALRSGSLDRVWIAGKTYDANVGKQLGNFTNGYIDDTGWWALTWLRAYDLTGQTRYRNTARADADLMWKTWDNTCGGGVWWSTQRTYKNAIANELMLEVNAALHNRLSGDVSYLERAQLGWRWFQSSGMINAEGLVNDGLNADCVNNGGTTWT